MITFKTLLETLDEAKKPKPGHNSMVMAKNISKVLAAVKKEEVELDESEAAYKKADRDEKRKAGTGEYFVTNHEGKKTHSTPFKTSDQAISHANAQEDKTGRVHTVHHIKNGKIQKQWQYSDSAGRFAPYSDHAGQTTNIHEEIVSSKDSTIKAVKPNVSNNNAVTTIADVKPLRMKLSQFRKQE